MKPTPGTGGLSVVMKIFFILNLVVVPHLYTFVKRHRTGVKMAGIHKATEENKTADEPANHPL